MDKVYEKSSSWLRVEYVSGWRIFHTGLLIAVVGAGEVNNVIGRTVSYSKSTMKRSRTS